MQKKKEEFFYSPSDLVTFMKSPFASFMDKWALQDPSLKKNIDKEDELAKALSHKGDDHENNFLRKLIEEGKQTQKIRSSDEGTMLAETQLAMSQGVEVIAQAYLTSGDFGGKADFLFRVPGASKLGDYHYEIWDTKLSKKTKSQFAIQLCCYAEMLEAMQGNLPDEIVVALGNDENHRLKLPKFFSYYKAIN